MKYRVWVEFKDGEKRSLDNVIESVAKEMMDVWESEKPYEACGYALMPTVES